MNNNGRGDAEGSATQVQSVDRALSILEYLAEHGSSGVTEIAKSLDVHKSTAFRLMTALEHRHLVEQVEERGKYRLGFGLIRLAGATSAQLDVARIGHPVGAELAAELGETVNIALLDSDSAINVAQEHADTVVGSRNWLGRRTPLHATSSGKVLLAHADERVLREVLDAGLERFTERTIVDAAALRRELDLVRERGWACCAEELEVGLNAVAGAIFDSAGRVIAAMSVSGPSYRLTTADFPAIAERLLAGTAEISKRMGFFPKP